MCGIAGFFDKSGDNRNSNIGQILIAMLEGLGLPRAGLRRGRLVWPECRPPGASCGSSSVTKRTVPVSFRLSPSFSIRITAVATSFRISAIPLAWWSSGVEDLPALAARIEALRQRNRSRQHGVKPRNHQASGLPRQPGEDLRRFAAQVAPTALATRAFPPSPKLT